MKPVFKYRNFIGKTLFVCIVVWMIIFSTWLYFVQDKMLDSQLVLVQNVQLNLDLQGITPNSPFRKFQYMDFPNADKLGQMPEYEHNNLQQGPGVGLDSFLGQNSIHNETLSKTTRKETCNRCFQPDFPILGETKICNNTLDVLILIFTKPGNIQQRKALRETWLKDIKNKSARYIFVIGTDTNSTFNSLAFVENSVYKDMLIIGFQDSYANLTYKTIMSFKWTQMKCKSAKYILKVDDDMWLNFDVLLRILKTGALRFSLGGKCNYGQYPFRDPKSKYYVSYSDYPMSVYPPFCSGTAYVADNEVIKAVLRISPNIPFFQLEDIYIALCLKKLNYEITNIPGFHSTKLYPLPCLYKSPMVITSHGVSPIELRNIYQASCEKDASMYIPKNPRQLPEKIILQQRFPKGKLARKSFHRYNKQLLKFDQQRFKHNPQRVVNIPQRAVHIPQRAVHIPPGFKHNPQRVVNIPQRAVHIPPGFKHNPQRVVNIPQRAVHIPPGFKHNPQRVVNIPQRAVHIPPGLKHNPQRAVNIPQRAVHIPPGFKHNPQRAVNIPQRVVHIPPGFKHNPQRAVNIPRAVHIPQRAVHIPRGFKRHPLIRNMPNGQARRRS